MTARGRWALDIAEFVFGGLFDFIDKRMIIRRVIILLVLYETVDVYLWAKSYAMLPGKSGADLSVVIAALTVPISILQGFMFRMYDESRVGSVSSGDVNVRVSK